MSANPGACFAVLSPPSTRRFLDNGVAVFPAGLRGAWRGDMLWVIAAMSRAEGELRMGLAQGIGAGLGLMLVNLAGCASPGSTERVALAAQPTSPILERVSVLGGFEAVKVASLGTSREGRSLHLIRVAGPGDVDPDDRPALLIVAGLDPMHRVGTHVALALAERLAQDHRDALGQHTVYIVPLLNPDTWAYLSRPGTPTWDFSRTMTPDDADRDGRTDEDGPEDLNADGHITMMRVRDPSPGSGLTATLMIDPDEPRLMKSPDPLKGERATHAMLAEGRDNDGDGRINEDPVGGVHLDMNFPAHWPEFADGAGRFPLCEPETKALADWMLAKESLVAVLIFTPKDTLVRVPEAGRMEASGRVPIGIENEDRGHYEAISTLFKDVTKMTAAPTGDAAGSLWSWSYSHLGLYAYSTPVWVRPDQVEQPAADAAAHRRPAEDEGNQPAPEPEGEDHPQSEDASGSIARLSTRFTAWEEAASVPLRMRFAEFESSITGEQTRLVNMVRVVGSDNESAEQPGAGRGRGGGTPARPQAAAPAARGATSEDAAWLKYSDEQRGGEGFIDWNTMQHPELGEVEVGGFVPGFKLNPPEQDIPRLVDQQAEFLVKLIEKLPRFVVEEPVVERVADGLWRVYLTVRNDGFLPLRSAIAVKARRLTPIVIRHDVPQERLISGRIVDNTAQTLAGSGGRHVGEWVFLAPEGDVVEFSVSVPEFGRHVVKVELREGAR